MSNETPSRREHEEELIRDCRISASALSLKCADVIEAMHKRENIIRDMCFYGEDTMADVLEALDMADVPLADEDYEV